MAVAEKAGGYINLRTSYAETAAIKESGIGRWRPQENLWRCNLSMPTCYALRGILGDRLTVDERLAVWAMREGDRWIKACQWLTNPNVLKLPPSSEIGPSTLHDAVAALELVESERDMKLKPFQAVASVQMVIAGGAINASQMGTGKTPEALTALKILEILWSQDKGECPWPALIVCPNSLKKNWSRELDKWLPTTPHTVVKGTPAKRRKALAELESDSHIAIINYESLRSFSRLAPYGSIRLKRCEDCGGDDGRPASCEVHDRELNHIGFKTVIADEAHRIKDPKTKQSRALGAASKGAPFRWAMTGTPIAHTPVDLWSLLHFIAPDEFPRRTTFTERYVVKFFNPFGGVEYGGLIPETEPELRLTLDARMLRHTKAQVLPFLPPKQYEIRTHELKKEEKAAYNALKESLIADVDGGQVIAWNPLTQLTRLLQMASSNVQVLEDGGVEPCEPSSKLDLLEDTLQDYTDEPVVIFFVSRKLLKLFAARLQADNKRYVEVHGEISDAERDLAVQRFQSGEVNRILLTVGAGGEGLTLTRASVGVFVQRPWSLIQSQQAEDRWHRIGSEIHESIKVIDLVAEDTAEYEVRESLVMKSENLEEVVRDKARLRALLS